MKHISETKPLDFLSRRQAQETEKKLDPKSTDIVNRLFVLFESICRGFDKQYSHSQSKLNIEKIQWAKGFMDSDITRIEQIEFGIKKCRLESPINTPTLGQFLKWCTPTPQDLGLPSVEMAYDEACRNNSQYNSEKKWSHQAVYHAYSLCNSFELTNLPKKNTFPIFERNYSITIDSLRRGEPLKAIPIAITHDKEFAEDKKVVNGFEHCNSRESAMEAMSKLLGKKFDGVINSGRVQENNQQDRI